MKFFDEFKKFIARGNVLDMAIGVVMGTAFTKIVNSLVTNIITPFLSILTGKIDVAKLEANIGGIVITYGQFIQAIIDFILIAFSIFCMVKIMNSLKDRFGKVEEAPVEEVAAEPEPSDEVKLLTEIRDLLNK